MKHSTWQTFGAWLKTRRRDRDVTQKELARAVGCAEITIRKIEADQLRPSKHLARITERAPRTPRRTRRVDGARATQPSRHVSAPDGSNSYRF